jgi:hypothetical protein
MSALTELLRGVFDYAGLFPPASLDLPTVVANYRRYRQATASWMLGRLILSTDQLEPFAELASREPALAAELAPPWLLAALVPAPSASEGQFESALAALDRFQSSTTTSDRRWAYIDTVEGKAATLDELHTLVERAHWTANVFVELPLVDEARLEGLVDGMSFARPGVHAKIRTGSVTAGGIPSPAQVAMFLDICARHDVGLKATAGLHHPLRGAYPLTYEPAAARAPMFGFVNFLVAACLAFEESVERAELEELLVEQDPRGITFDGPYCRWRGHELTAEQIRSARTTRVISIGTCSFEEPLEELSPLGWLNNASLTAV